MKLASSFPYLLSLSKDFFTLGEGVGGSLGSTLQ